MPLYATLPSPPMTKDFPIPPSARRARARHLHQAAIASASASSLATPAAAVAASGAGGASVASEPANSNQSGAIGAPPLPSATSPNIMANPSPDSSSFSFGSLGILATNGNSNGNGGGGSATGPATLLPPLRLIEDNSLDRAFLSLLSREIPQIRRGPLVRLRIDQEFEHGQADDAAQHRPAAPSRTESYLSTIARAGDSEVEPPQPTEPQDVSVSVSSASSSFSSGGQQQPLPQQQQPQQQQEQQQQQPERKGIGTVVARGSRMATVIFGAQEETVAARLEDERRRQDDHIQALRYRVRELEREILDRDARMAHLEKQLRRERRKVEEGRRREAEMGRVYTENQRLRAMVRMRGYGEVDKVFGMDGDGGADLAADDNDWARARAERKSKRNHLDPRDEPTRTENSNATVSVQPDHKHTARATSASGSSKTARHRPIASVAAAMTEVVQVPEACESTEAMTVPEIRPTSRSPPTLTPPGSSSILARRQSSSTVDHADDARAMLNDERTESMPATPPLSSSSGSTFPPDCVSSSPPEVSLPMTVAYDAAADHMSIPAADDKAAGEVICLDSPAVIADRTAWLDASDRARWVTGQDGD